MLPFGGRVGKGVSYRHVPACNVGALWQYNPLEDGKIYLSGARLRIAETPGGVYKRCEDGLLTFQEHFSKRIKRAFEAELQLRITAR